MFFLYYVAFPFDQKSSVIPKNLWAAPLCTATGFSAPYNLCSHFANLSLAFESTWLLIRSSTWNLIVLCCFQISLSRTQGSYLLKTNPSFSKSWRNLQYHNNPTSSIPYIALRTPRYRTLTPLSITTHYWQTSGSSSTNQSTNLTIVFFITILPFTLSGFLFWV